MRGAEFIGFSGVQYGASMKLATSKKFAPGLMARVALNPHWRILQVEEKLKFL